VNAVKDFLEVNGYGGLVPVERLRLGAEEAIEEKGLTLRLPEGVEDRSPSRLRVVSETGPSSIAFASDRVATTWDLSRLEQELLGGETFGAFRATGAARSRTLSGGRLVLGGATGRVGGDDGAEAKIEYALFENGPEKVILRYVGAAEAVAFNRSALKESLRGARVDSFLEAPIGRPLDPSALPWENRDLEAPGAPYVSYPRGWKQERAAPFPCRGLPPVTSAVAVSPPEDFRLSLRAGWWSERLDPEAAARACAPTRESGSFRYAYTLDYLGVRYVVSGVFQDTGTGLLQLEVVSPQEMSKLVAGVASSFLDRNLRTPPPR
jgi:hypothetical protein